jgi:hypothetical protein
MSAELWFYASIPLLLLAMVAWLAVYWRWRSRVTITSATHVAIEKGDTIVINNKEFIVIKAHSGTTFTIRRRGAWWRRFRE